MTGKITGTDGVEEPPQISPAIWRATYSDEDLEAFANPVRTNSHFGLPLPMAERVFSISLNRDGRSNVHDAGKQYRSHYFGNMVALRLIKQLHPDAWIWDERYRFTLKNGSSKDEVRRRAQAEFVRIMGAGRIEAVHAAAVEAGLDRGRKMVGMPDLAVYVPDHQPAWRFIEIKMPARKDKLRESQTGWLRLLSCIFGPDAAVEFVLVEA